MNTEKAAIVCVHPWHKLGRAALSKSQITVTDLSKRYRVPEREPGLLASLRSLGKRRYRDVEAVQDVSFTVEPRARWSGCSGQTARARRPRSRCWPGCCDRPAVR